MSSKVGGNEKPNMVVKIFSKQIPTSIPIKPVQTMATTTTSNSTVNVDMLKLESNKGWNINEGGSGSSTVKPTKTTGKKDK